MLTFVSEIRRYRNDRVIKSLGVSLFVVLLICPGLRSGSVQLVSGMILAMD